MRYVKKPVVVEAITFDQLVEYGRTHGANIVNGMPWSFTYEGQPITHEDDNCYLIPTLKGTMKFQRGDMLITGVKGEIYPCKRDVFDATYEPWYVEKLSLSKDLDWLKKMAEKEREAGGDVTAGGRIS